MRGQGDMRASRDQAAQSRARVVETAAEMFRAQGYDGTGIAALMQAAGLTNGAFYKQFESKEALIAEATAAALAGNAEAWQEALDAGGADPLQAAADWYLSPAHLIHREKGCAYAALGAEAPRHVPALRQAFEGGVRATVAQIVAAEAAAKTVRTEDDALQFLSRMVGALLLARAVEDPALAARILEANRTVA